MKLKRWKCRYWAVASMFIALFLLPSFGARTLRAASDPQPIARALACGKIGEAEGVAPGADLFRINIDLRDYPNAVCNDGTPATMFVRRFATKRDKNKWILFLLGGGDCTTALECAQRWCSIATGYGANKMSTSYLNAQGATKSIEGKGIFSQDASINNFAGWNQVFVYYCSSDNWEGSASNVRLTAADENGNQLDYLINFRGADIVEAVIATLQREPRGDPVTYKESGGNELVLPDIDKAEMVLFTGSSAGGDGVKNNVDRVGDLLRRTNKNCKHPDNCSLDYRGVIDANYPPSFHSLDLTHAAFCTAPPFLCTYEDVYTNKWNHVHIDTFRGRGDESCLQWHQRNMPGTEWTCADAQHVVTNHLTTPLFIRFDLQDQNLSGKFLDQNLTTLGQFGELTHDQLVAVTSLDSFAEEGSVRSGGARLSTPGVFGPQCTQHYGLSVSLPFFGVSLSDSGKKYSFHDVLWNWVQGSQPQQIVRVFAGPGPAPDCP